MRSVALVTGAGRGLGKVLATFLAGQGHDLVITARTDTELEEVARSLRSAGAKVAAFPGNITDPGHRTRLLQETSAMGDVSLLVNNAWARPHALNLPRPRSTSSAPPSKRTSSPRLPSFRKLFPNSNAHEA